MASRGASPEGAPTPGHERKVSPRLRVAADRFRAALGRPTPTEMDAAESYSSRIHVAGENASILTMTASLADADVLKDVEVACVVGNSMGWYTALAVAGALPLDDAFTLVETMGQYQAGNVIGGQVLYPLVDADWRALPSPELDAALREVPDLHWSIRLGGQAVIGGTPAALDALMKRLPVRTIGDRDAPFQLPLHSAFHTPLMRATSERAFADLAGLAWQAPRVPLVDGRGAVFRPRAADPAAIRDYTLGHQVVEPYDFTTSVRVAVREYAPDAIVLLGPGGNLGGAVAQSLITEGWGGLDSRAAFLRRQEQDPFVISMARPEQRARVT
ncbi:MAG: ACP S-malonyltransferase [Myxococcota bacterium]